MRRGPRYAFSSTTIPWERIAGVRIGRHKLLSEVCPVDLADGSSRGAIAIQLPNATRGCNEMHMLNRLNQMLALHPHA